ncbi:hypothetical protein V5799_011678 [Amblyomma americanum]|uniref:M13 family peptidase n=1 Tax=Amblyomma americanum TaxID=6943 RepID=A0AAQ4EGG8_AMBAM
MNLPVDACYDFHSYVCGGWENQQEVPIYKGNFGIYDMLADKVKTTIQNILAGIVPSFTNQNITDKVGIIFNACMEFENTEDRPDGLVNVLNSYGLGDWPMLENTTTNATDMLLKTGIIGMFDLFVQRDSQNSTSHVIQICQPSMFTAPDDEYKEAMKQAALLINPDINETDFMEYIERVVALRTSAQNIPLLELLNKEFSKVNINLTENDVVQLHPLNYYEAVDEFMPTFDPTTMFNYAGVRVISTFGEQASKNFRSAFPLHLANYPRGERSVVCADIIRNKLPAISSYLYEQRCFNASVKQEVGDIARRIKDSFSEMFQSSSWIDNTTKTALLDEVEQNYKLYKDIPYIPINATFVEMLHNITERGYRRNLKKLREPNEEREFSSSIGAFYDLQENAVVIPWGLLQHPIYQYGLPLSLNYGGIGGIIGHAISRAFDAKDITMSLAENLTRSEFHNRTQCFVTQYDSFPYFLFGMRSYFVKRFGTSSRLNFKAAT